MFPGEIPGRSRLELLGRRRGADRVFRNGWRQCVTKVNHFYNGNQWRVCQGNVRNGDLGLVGVSRLGSVQDARAKCHDFGWCVVESTKNCGAHLMLQVRTRTLDGTLRGSSSRGIRLNAGARSVEAEPCAV